MTSLLARLGDRVNPIVVKEMRQAVNSRLVAAALLLFLGVQLVAMTLMIGEREFGHSPDDLNLRAGRQVFTFVQGILLVTCMLLIPALTSGRLAAERSDANVDLLFISSLSPRAIVAGKLFAAALLALLIFSACAPFMTFAYVLRGLDMPTILLVLGADYLAVLGGTMFALLLAAVPANRGLRVLLGFGGFIGLCYLFGGSLMMTAAFLAFEFSMDVERWEFWAGVAGLAALAVGLIGLMFVWATALVSPPTANRALPVRVYTLALWLAAAAGCAGWSLYLADSGPVVMWGICGALLFAFQILIAVSERDEWGPRVARRIPRNPLLRVPAFFFFSGVAGGLAFALLGGILSVAGIGLWAALTPAHRWSIQWSGPVQSAGAIVVYTYCYCMTAVVLRRLGGKAGLHPSITWLVAAILFGLGCTLPYIAGFVLFDRGRAYRSVNDTYWLYMTNPFASVWNAFDGTEIGKVVIPAFLAAWAGVVTLVNLPWLLRQVANFRPPSAKAAAPGPPA